MVIWQLPDPKVTIIFPDTIMEEIGKHVIFMRIDYIFAPAFLPKSY
jgi:hypothetical protein